MKCCEGSTALHAAQISFYTDPGARTPETLLEVWPSLVDVAEAAAMAGSRVTVLQASQHTRTILRNGVVYEFFPFGQRSGSSAPYAQLERLLRTIDPQVLHVHGLGFWNDVRALARLAPRTPLLLQDHADRPPRLWRRRAWRKGHSSIAGVAFCARAQAQPFLDAGLLREQARIYEIPESSTRFKLACAQSAPTSDTSGPSLLWVGHLDENKDPLTVLEGVAEAARQLPGLRLSCCFATAPLLHAVTAKVESDARLRDRVRLLGRKPHADIEKLMHEADVFVLGSHREGSGYSLIEAMACGVTPVVTDIPSFRALTGNGAVGALWPCEDPLGLRDALVSACMRTGPAERARVRAHFDTELSFEAVGRKLRAMYEEALERLAPRGPSRLCDEQEPPAASAA